MTEPDARARREYGAALALLGAGGALLLISFGLTWGTAQVPLLAGAEGAVRVEAFTGRDLFPAAAMSGWIALAGVAGIVATRSWGRVLVAAICLAAGLAGTIAALAYATAPARFIDAAASATAGSPLAAASESTLGWLVAGFAGVVVVAASGAAIVRGRRWPRLGARYERTARTQRPVSPWEAQDLGHDPTADLVE